MFSKFTVSSLKLVPKNYQVKFYSASKGWTVERANLCSDKDKILCFIEKNYMKQDLLAKALIKEPFPAFFRDKFKLHLDQGLTVVAKCQPKQNIIGVSINRKNNMSTGTKICKIAQETKDCSLKKYLQTLSKIETDSKLNNKLGVDEMCLIGVLAMDDKYQGKCLDVDLVKKSLELAAEKYSHAKFVCFSEHHKKIAENLKMTKGWCSPYKNLLCTGEITPRGLPKAPHNNIYMYHVNLKKDEIKPCKPCS